MTILYIFDIVLARTFSKLLDLIIVKTHKYKTLVAKCTTIHAFRYFIYFMQFH